MNSSLMNPELHNLLRRCGDPIFAARVVFFYLRRFLFSLHYRFIPSRWYYPREVRRAFLRTQNSKFKIQPLGNSDSSHAGQLKLATGFLAYSDTPNWKQEFEDPEQTMSLHRWGWLNYDYMEYEQGLALVRSWLRVMGPVPQGIAGTPYTTSERVSNALLFLSSKGIPDDLRQPLLIMSDHVAHNIEYHGVRSTGNHVVNNARALFFAGQTFGVKALSDLAVSVVQDALPWLVTEDGFLREESSHYHLLFTRWLVEMQEVSRETGHEEMRIFLDPWVRRCMEKCLFFLVLDKDGMWSVPLIGDVSPDCTPKWLIEYLVPRLSPGARAPFLGNGFRAFPKSGWFRLDRGRTTIFWHAPQENMIHRATHGHADACSFVFFQDGESVLVDPGRETYARTVGCLAQDHTTVTIDGLGPFLYDRVQKFPAFYQKRDVQVEWREEGEKFIFSIFHTGFRRLKEDRIDHTRRFIVKHGAVEIEDEFYGRRPHRVEAFFHLAPQVDSVAVQPVRGERRTRASWTFPSYGVKVQSSVVTVSCTDTFPFTLRYTVAV